MKNETSTGLLATLLLLFNSQVCLAAPLWSDFSGAYVAGRGFTLDPDQQRTVSLEYASGYTWGDTFTTSIPPSFAAMSAPIHFLERRPRGGR